MRMEFMSTYLLFVVGVSVLLWSKVWCGSDTISAGESLFPNQNLISKGGKFELGFFDPGNNSTSNYYVGIWYKNIPLQTVVWVLNRDNPITYSLYENSELQISDGALLLRSGRLEIYSTYYKTLNATEALLLDTGNLVLRNASGILWQSFEHPTDTWLPGAHLVYGSSPFDYYDAEFVSWMNPDDPSSGSFSLGMGPYSDLSIKQGIETLWSSGAWQGETFPPLDLKNYYNFTYLERDGVVYNVNNESVLSRIVIDYLGRMMQFEWSEARQAWDLLMLRTYWCTAYSMCRRNTMCGGNDSPECRCLTGFKPQVEREWGLSNYSSGCVRKRPLRCTDKVGFIKEMPQHREYKEDLPNNACEFFCSNNCSCNAYAYSSSGGCLLFRGDFLDLENPQNYSAAGVDIYVKVKSRGKKRKVLLLALALPLTAALLLSCFGYCYLRPKLINKKSKGKHQNLLLLDLNPNGNEYKKGAQVGTNNNGEEKNVRSELPIFSFSSIVAATNNFSITNKLGEGGFGPVYKGELLNGQFVAVKRLSKISEQGLEEFRNETELIAKLQHRNLVGILGCCVENEEKILVYEYMPNKSLDFFIFEHRNRGEVLDWAKRVQIIEGIAQGLLYLHHYSRLRIVHRDLKASNILLDAEMNPKISDFGMARIFGGNDLQANTERIVGTYGYMSPEYAMEGVFSVKSDVFAFGVLMLEIISGKKNADFYGSDYLSLLGYVWNMWKQERVVEIVDPSLEMHAASSLAALRYIKIGLLCVQENPDDRPLMSDIVGMLNNEDAETASPLNPAFIVTRSSATPNKVQICSVNDLTLSHVEPR